MLLGALLAAGPAWAGPPAEEFRSLLRQVTETGMQHEAVAGLRGRLELARERSPREDWPPLEAAVGDVEKFYHHFYWLKKGAPSTWQEQQALRRELARVFDDLDLRDPALEQAYLRQIAPPAEVQKAVDQKLGDLGAEAKTEAERKKYDEVRGLMKNGDYQGAYDKFNRAFDQAGSAKSRESAAFIRESLKPRPDEDANQFTEHRKAIAAGLDKVEVPLPGAKAQAGPKKSKIEKAAEELMPDKKKAPAKPGVVRETQTNAAEAVLGILCLFSAECQAEVRFHQSMRHLQ